MTINEGIRSPDNSIPVPEYAVPVPSLKPIEETAAYRGKDATAYEQSTQFFDHARKLKIIVAGAGCSGIDLAHAVESGRLRNVDLRIYEKNAGIGGTWWENRYPGCGCDIPSHNYLFSWAPNPRWSSFYASAPEILEYMEDVTEKFHLQKHITTRQKITKAEWNPATQKWLVTSRRTDGRSNVISAKGVTDGEVGPELVEECDVFINASGFFNNWRWPNTPGREKYKGVLVHSADYPTALNLRGKCVAVIGNGSSGIQATAAAQKRASKVVAYIRNPTWITANMGSRFIPPGQTNLFFDEKQKQEWEADPNKYLEYRKSVERELNIRFPLFIRDTPQQAMAREFTTKSMMEKLAPKPELREKLMPTFAVGCRRPTPGAGYLEALCADNCEVAWGEMETFTESGIRSADGTEREFDVIIAATGFDMSFVPRWPVLGVNGKDLQKEWAKDPACYMSTVAEDMPNYFVYLGPGSPVGQGSLITSIERITDYICDIVNKMQTENYSSFQLKSGKAKAYQHQMLSWLEKTVWGDNCRSSFKNGTISGPLHAFHPGSRLHYFELLRRRRYEDFEWKSRSSDPIYDFAWHNNGFLEAELTDGVEIDPTWYLNQDEATLARFPDARRGKVSSLQDGA